MRDEERFKLLYGPYRVPLARPGDELFCEMRGLMKVIAFSDGPIPWPRGRGLTADGRQRGHPSYILCGDLVRAVQRESSLAVQHWWGVSVASVLRWRRALGVEETNEGTRRLRRDKAPETFPLESTRRAVKLAAQPEVRARAMQTWRARADQARNRGWTDAEIALLGMLTDAQVAQRLGCSKGKVTHKRHTMNIPACSAAHMRVTDETQVRVLPDKIRARRTELGLYRKETARRAGMSDQMLGQIEAGRGRLRAALLIALAEVLQCAAADIAAPDQDVNLLQAVQPRI